MDLTVPMDTLVCAMEELESLASDPAPGCWSSVVA